MIVCTRKDSLHSMLGTIQREFSFIRKGRCLTSISSLAERAEKVGQKVVEI